MVKTIDATGNEELYVYDGNGNVLSKTDADGYVTQYSYSATDLVSAINYSDKKQVTYAYNKVGELVKMDDWNGTTTFELDKLYQLKAVTDHKGNKVEYIYDETNRMTVGRNEKNEASIYTYNGLGVRVGQEMITEDNTHGYTDFHCETPSIDTGIQTPEVVLRSFVIDYTSPDQRVLVESEAGGTGFTYQNMYGVNKLSVKVTSFGIDWWGQQVHKNVMKAYTHTDRLGSTVGLTDDYGRVMTRVQYSEWGDLLATDPITITHGFRMISPQNNYTGHEFDDVLGVYYAKARLYDQTNRRFTAMDPVKGSIIEPQSLVPYVYVVDNPLRYVDPLGLNKNPVEVLKDSTNFKNVATRKDGNTTYYELSGVIEVLGGPTSTNKKIMTINLSYSSAIDVLNSASVTVRYDLSDLPRFFKNGKTITAMGTYIAHNDGSGESHPITDKNGKAAKCSVYYYGKKTYVTLSGLKQYFSYVRCEDKAQTTKPTPSNPNPSTGPKRPSQSLKPSQKIINYILDYESFSPAKYDANPPHGDWTIGYGHKIRASENYDNKTLTKEQAKQLFDSDLKKMTETTLGPMLEQHNIVLTQNQYDALVDFAFNMGEYSFSDNDDEAYVTIRNFVRNGDYNIA